MLKASVAIVSSEITTSSLIDRDDLVCNVIKDIGHTSSVAGCDDDTCGGAFLGKDPSEVDRLAAYADHYVATNIVAAGLADRCEIQVSYAIGVAEPKSVSINTFGTGKIFDEKIIQLVREHFDLRPYAIINILDLPHPMCRQTAAYCHFGRNPFEMTVRNDTFTAFPWEETDKAQILCKGR